MARQSTTSSRSKCAVTGHVRVLLKGSWQRDLLRVKGGITDYCEIVEISEQVLRVFPISRRSPVKPFKPVLDGFEINFGRKVLPAGEKE